MIFPDKSLATRFEQHLASDMQEYVHAFKRLFPDFPADDLSIGGGVAICVGENYLNTAVGIGIMQPVTPDEIDALETFFQDNQAILQVEMCAFTDESLLTEVNQRGYALVDFTTAYTHDLVDIPDKQSDVIVKPIDDTQKDLWVRTVTDIADDDTTTDTRLAQTVTHRTNTTCFLATSDGAPVGASALSIFEGSAICYFTATRKAYRNRGVQTAMLQARLNYAKSQGCEMAMATSNPGVQSMRNMMRAGFQVAYTRFEMQKPIDGN